MAVIELDHVTRIYQKYSSRHRFQTFKSAIVKGDLFGSLRPDELVKAVDDISLHVEKGQTFGLIGENGSGKSTILKLVAGIAKPTSGRISVTGKVSALIELGAGFHPEISGRENVFINGIMLGLSKKEITRKFDEIVRFAELEEFIEAPVKTYSSGMYMRLGFSIAINVNPEVLLIDEVLAVGDAAFVPKCLDRIDDFRRRKKTILFVSHDLATVAKICNKVAWMKDGKIRMLGEPKRVVDAYMQDVTEEQETEFRERKEEAAAAVEVAAAAPAVPPAIENAPVSLPADVKPAMDKPVVAAPVETAGPVETPAAAAETTAVSDEGRREQRWGKREVEIRRVVLRNAKGEEKHVFHPGDSLVIELDIAAKEPVKDFVFGIAISNSMGVMCYGTNTNLEEYESVALSGEGRVVCRIESLPLINGTYYLDLAVHKRDGYPYDYHRNMYSFLVSSMIRDEGVARLAHAWEFSPEITVKLPSKSHE
ncbi:MAG: ABC transporter ATP-binding protein [Candidatus Aminicenantes bacterium]|nr:ABC transporter ATP-binding protein [Candidatus Aminicenantes bacterium]